MTPVEQKGRYSSQRNAKRKKSSEAGSLISTMRSKSTQSPRLAGSPGIDSVPAQTSRTHPVHETMRSGIRMHANEAAGSSTSQRQFRDSSAEYATNVLSGLKSLGVQTEPALDRVLTDRHGQTSLRGFCSVRVIGQGSDFGSGDFTRESSSILQSRSRRKVTLGNQIDENKWGSTLAGVGYQFERFYGENRGNDG